MNLIDTHTHLFLDSFQNDIQEVIIRAQNAGISKFLLPNIDSSSIPLLLELTKTFPETCFPMMGLHPTSVKENYREELEIVHKFLFDKPIPFIALGEIGIDLYWDKQFFIQQKDAFIKQIHWAKELNAPIVIHARESFKEIFSIMREEKIQDVTGVFHSFTGTVDDAKQILDLGFKFGIGGVVTFKNSGLDAVVEKIPLSEIILETDSPFLAPVPKRGKRNESAYLVHIAEKVAEIHNTTLEKVAEVTTKNARELFNL